MLLAPFLAHIAVMTQTGTAIAGVLLAIQAALLGWVAMSLGSNVVRRYALRATVAVGLAAATLLVWRSSQNGLVLAAAVPHAVAYLGLLVLFAASLAPGREPVITMVAQRSRGVLSKALLAYTRDVTIAWCIFFVVQLAASLLLWLFAPLAWWSVFVNLCTIPLVLVMFGAELAYRHWRHGIYRPAQANGRWWHAIGQIRLPIRQARP